MTQRKSSGPKRTSLGNSVEKGLTGIPTSIHWPATQTSGGREPDELDEIAVEKFLDTLARVAVDVATRGQSSQEKSD